MMYVVCSPTLLSVLGNSFGFGFAAGLGFAAFACGFGIAGFITGVG